MVRKCFFKYDSMDVNVVNKICAFQRNLRETPPAKRIPDKCIPNNKERLFRKNNTYLFGNNRL